MSGYGSIFVNDMAWTITTYSGYQMTSGTPNGWRVAMFEICRAVNERQGALNITKTQFQLPDGSFSADVASDDFIGLFVSPLGGPWKANLERARDAIIEMLNGEYFLTTDGGSTTLTKAAVETAISADLDADQARPNEAAYLQALQDALDLMLYCRRTFGLSASSPTVDNRVSDTIPPFQFTSAQDAWTNAYNQTPSSTSVTSTNAGLRWFQTNLYTDPTGPLPLDNYYTASMWDNMQGYSVTLDLDGTLTKFTYDYTVDPYTVGGPIWPSVPCVINSTTIPQTSSSGSYQGSNGDLTLSGANSMDYTSTNPSTVPWNPGVGTELRAIRIDSITVYWDISSVLADQA